ncbi:DUF1073 domain-containing protein [Orenia marismortui]|uniref:Anti-CBASS protein Acb1-like N-terminal domain-containing protein n=1 Tax=Orenia marismortui TaxID=46469 RepID=A0A4R8H015_9FIRM|nr:DUF1073 domain-containing protein [Orenia marismortui]TDX48287.1 hypothetical protein C7959_13014 [Orenia marismortui]
MGQQGYSIGNVIKDEVRQDFMHSSNPNSSKGKSRLVSGRGDPLVSQRPNQGIKLTDEQVTNLYKTNRIFQNIIDIPAEDMTREWIDFQDTDKKLKKSILDKLNDLDAQPKINDMCEYERLRGDGFCSIGAREKGSLDIGKEINKKSLIDIDYIHAFSKMKVKDAAVNEDPFSKEYGEIEYYELKGENNSADTRLVHKDRILHHQVRTVEDELWGIPLIQSLYDPLVIFDNVAWSTGQIAYSLAFKVLKTDGVDIANRKDYAKRRAWYEAEFNSNSLAIIGKEDELSFVSPTGNINALKEIYNFTWEYLAGAARMPKSHLLGQAQGTITGGQFDSLNYYARIAGLQENFLRPHIEYLIDLLFWAKDSGVGKGSMDPVGKYNMTFNPLWKLDKETDAKIRKMVAETHKIYIDSSVFTPDEVRQGEFGKIGLLEKLDMSEEELDAIADTVEEARKKYQEGS